MRSRYVECLSNASYPIILPDSDLIADQSLQVVRCETDVPTDRNVLCECWALFRTGQFIHNRAVLTHKEISGSIHYLEILRVISHASEFSRRMAEEDVLSPRAVLSIALNNIAGLNLQVPGQSPSTFCKSDKTEFTRQLSPADLNSRSQEIAIDIASQCYSAFGWNDPNPGELRQQQRRFV